MLPPVAAYGAVLMSLGLTGAVVGIALALYQRDLKRVLAYSTVENIGVVLLGLGLGLWGRAHGDATLSALGFAGALLHVWNHAAMKGLMFLGAGSVLHGAGSKDLEHLGGLLRRMRWTGAAMIFGSVAIAALPPLNGFVSEWLLYRGMALAGLHHPGTAGLAALVGVAVLALVGGLAALCFVRLVGVGLLGQSRSEAALHAHEPGRGMTIPMGVLVVMCLALALAPHGFIVLFAPLLSRLTGDAGADSIARAAGALGPLVVVNLALIGTLALVGTLVARRVRGAAEDETWSCAYEAPGPRLQYTARSFSELLAEHLLPRAMRARLRVAAPKGPFPATAELAIDATDPLTRAAYEPIVARFADRFARFHWLQRGSLHVYLLYIVAVTVGALLWSAARDAGWGR
jgi:NADH:ubiquinone oxidoreductase subunit 5 (subunit L)/multisubunit Na+/H+ antiporter MnhA subunit